jgi:DNA-binding PadR family transcriptional regulator
MVAAPLTTGAALLLVLRDGPSYGIDLVRRVNAATRGRVRPALGTVHRSLQQLQRSGHVRRWDVVPGGRRGARARVYYELTSRGIAKADATATTLRTLVAPAARKPSPAKVRAMRKRLRSAADVSAFVVGLQDRLVKGHRGSR